MRGRTIALADAGAICTFVAVGLVAHRDVTLRAFLRDACPLLAGWFAAALAVGAYRMGSVRRMLVAWAVGIPLGVILRAILLGRGANGREAAFLGVAMTFTLLLLLGFRLAASRVTT